MIGWVGGVPVPQQMLREECIEPLKFMIAIGASGGRGVLVYQERPRNVFLFFPPLKYKKGGKLRVRRWLKTFSCWLQTLSSCCLFACRLICSFLITHPEVVVLVCVGTSAKWCPECDAHSNRLVRIVDIAMRLQSRYRKTMGRNFSKPSSSNPSKDKKCNT